MQALNYVSPMGETDDDREALFQAVYDAAHFRALHSPYPFNQQHAEDIAQEVVAQFAAADQAAIENPAAWANRVAAHVAARMWDRQRLDDPQAAEAEPESAAEVRKQGRRALQLFLQDGQPSSREGLLRQQADLLVAQLSERELELVRAVAESLSHAEIAERMGYAGADSVKTTLARIRRKITAAAESAGIDVEWGDHPRPY